MVNAVEYGGDYGADGDWAVETVGVDTVTHPAEKVERLAKEIYYQVWHEAHDLFDPADELGKSAWLLLSEFILSREAKLVKTIRRYARHGFGCFYGRSNKPDSDICLCGLDTALKEAGAE